MTNNWKAPDVSCRDYSVGPQRWVERATDYNANVNLITTILDCDQLGGPDLTVDSTIFEM